MRGDYIERAANISHLKTLRVRLKKARKGRTEGYPLPSLPAPSRFLPSSLPPFLSSGRVMMILVVVAAAAAEM